ncbi:MAG TPA: cytochrome c [Candidatus Solibacter sp.]|nr:cytochrome c [Candidatus Solibacter sp.]
MWACALPFLAAPAFPHDLITTNLTWSKEISRVVYQHCASCHREGGTAFSLMTYEEARPWAKAIRDEVLNRRMPPWDAVKGVGEFRDDPSLSVPEIDLVVAWVEGGAPEGNPIYAPSPPIVDSTPALPAPLGIELKSALTLSAPMILTGIRPNGATEVAALLPDQSVRRLLWVRDFRESSNRTYTLLRPMRLPKGTKVIVYGAGAILTTAPGP